MPGIGSLNDIYNAIQNGRQVRTDWNKNFPPTTAAVASETHVLARGGGNPGPDALFNTGTNLTFQPVSYTTANASSIPIGPDVQAAGYYKQLVSGSAFSAAATTMPSVLKFIDVIGFYRVTSVTTNTSQAMTNTLGQTNNITAVDTGSDYVDHTAYNLLTGTRVQLTTSGTLPAGLSLATDYFIIKVSDTRCKFATTYANAIAGTAIDITSAGSGTHTLNWLLPRYTNGEGVQVLLYNSNATALGAVTPNLSLPNYTNQAQVSGRTTPTLPALPVGKPAAANGLVLYSGTGAGKYAPAMPLASGDSGVSQINNIQLSASYVLGEFTALMYREILTLPMTTIGVAAERNLALDLPSLPRIYDGAALYPLLTSSAATPVNSAFIGHLQAVWG